MQPCYSEYIERKQTTETNIMTTQSENVQLRLNTKRDEITIKNEGKIYVISFDYLENSETIMKIIKAQMLEDIKNGSLDWAEV